MAKFHSLKVKEKKYAFKFFNNQEDPAPATVNFLRFPLPNETFIIKAPRSIFSGLNYDKLKNGDEKEIDKMSSAVMEFYVSSSQTIDFDRFISECVESFSDFEFDGKEVKTVDDFKALSKEVYTIIASDLHKYASTPDTFSAGGIEGLIIAYKLLLLGQYESPGESVDEFGEPWPIQVPGHDLPIRSDKIESYFDDAFWFYQNFYMTCRENGRPFGDIGWINEPAWISQLITHFNLATKQIENYNIAKSSKT